MNLNLMYLYNELNSQITRATGSSLHLLFYNQAVSMKNLKLYISLKAAICIHIIESRRIILGIIFFVSYGLRVASKAFWKFDDPHDLLSQG